MSQTLYLTYLMKFISPSRLPSIVLNKCIKAQQQKKNYEKNVQ